MASRCVKIAALIVFLAVTGCRKSEPTAAPVTPSVTPRPPVDLMPTAIATATATTTPTPTTTATPTATPTPTALPVRVSGDLREGRLSTPFPQSGAPCGVVDLLDFPLDPPHAENASGGGDFGVFRSNYNGYHAGEDWWGARRGSTFGTPVHSIAHGTVTYAQPLGWGVDQGVVIVRHVFSDGNTVLSFYGHLDPPSVVLKVGDCVARGDVVGRIGRPRRAPHLHFEIRHHTPNAPGPGYWSRDPTLAGWESPSQYIWDNRIVGSPGVQWTRPFVALGTKSIGMQNDDTLVVIEDHQLVGINVTNGSVRWRQPSSIRVEDAVMDVDRSVIYAADQLGRVEAFRLPDMPDADAPTPVSLWQTRVDGTGFPTLMPLPRGGVVVSLRRQTFGLSPRGTLLWARDNVSQVFDWALVEDRLVVSTMEADGPMWIVDRSGPRAWAAQVSGYLAVAGDWVWVYDANGIYRLDLETPSAELVYALPTGLLRRADGVALPDGGVLVAHPDAFDKRLIALNADGTLRWQRSYAEAVRGQQAHLVMLDGRVYLVSQHLSSSSSEVSVFAIDLDSAELTRVFIAGSRDPLPEDTWVLPIGDSHILINVGGGHMVALDPLPAFEAVSRPTSSD